MQRLIIAIVIGGLMLGGMACESSQDDTSGTQTTSNAVAEMSGDVAKAVEIANKIQAAPDNAGTILAEYDMTQESFETLLYDIASDPDLSRQYSKALNK